MKRLSAILGDRALLLVIAIVAVNAYAIHDELTAGRFDLNDSVFHYTLIDRMAQAIQQGENPLDCWVSEWTLGYPVPRTYQILGHLSIAVLYLALGKTISVLTLFVWARFLLVALLPLTVYACARLLRLPRTAAVASALVSPLVATNGLFGLEYGAYLWRGDGLFAQAAAMHLLLLTLAYAFRAVRGMSSVVRAGLFLGLTFLTHFIYGFIGAISVVLLVFIPQTASLTKRVVRIAAIAIVSFGVAAFQLVPILQDGWLVNHSRWEAQWKWDSFGARYVFANLLRGSLFDFGRLPVLSLLALLGSIVCVVKFRNMKEDSSKIDTADGRAPAATYIFLVAGAGLWALMFCGRPTWGVLFTILGARNVQLHRLIGGLHAFGFFLGGIGLSTIWVAYRNLRFKYRNALAALVSLVILLPAVKERRVFLQQNAEWSKSNLASLKSEEKDVTAVVSLLKAMPARTYSGLATNWGTRFRVGSVAFHGILSVNHIAAVSWPYHWMALTSDIVAVSFDETNPAHYRLFNVGAVVAPVAQPVPPFLALKASYGRFRIYQTPANGYFDIVNVPYAVRVYPKDFYAVSYGWLKSNWASRLSHLLMDTDGKIGSEMPQISASRPLPEAQAGPSLGFVSGERRTGEVYEARTEVQRPAYLLFKMTYHPNWRAIVDGVSQRPVMLTPGFMGVPLQPGTHEVRFQYEPGYLKTVLIVFGAFIIFGAVIINGSSEF